MKEVQIKDNKTNLKCYIDEFPKIELIPDEVKHSLANSLEPVIAEHFIRYIKRKGERSKKKEEKE